MFMITAPLINPTAAATSPQQDLLDDMAKLGHRLARLVVEQAEAGTIAAIPASLAFERVGRSIRRDLWLAHMLAAPVKTTDRIATRKQIIRQVEDAIQRHADDDAAESLHEELMDRMDSLDLEDELDKRPVEDIIADIVRDLGLAARPGTNPWKRRTPEDLAHLNAQAARPVPRTNPQNQADPVRCNSS
jgi:hypothetical protein